MLYIRREKGQDRRELLLAKICASERLSIALIANFSFVTPSEVMNLQLECPTPPAQGVSVCRIFQINLQK